MTDDEWAAEIANRTMHGVMHIGRVADGDGRVPRADGGAREAERPARRRLHGGDQAVSAPDHLPGDDAAVRARLAQRGRRRRMASATVERRAPGGAGLGTLGARRLRGRLPGRAGPAGPSGHPRSGRGRSSRARPRASEPPPRERGSRSGSSTGRPARATFVLGWPVRRSTPEYALLGAESRLGMPAELLVKLERDGVLFSTMIEQRNPIMRAVWAPIAAPHRGSCGSCSSGPLADSGVATADRPQLTA